MKKPWVLRVTTSAVWHPHKMCPKDHERVHVKVDNALVLPRCTLLRCVEGWHTWAKWCTRRSWGRKRWMNRCIHFTPWLLRHWRVIPTPWRIALMMNWWAGRHRCSNYIENLDIPLDKPLLECCVAVELQWGCWQVPTIFTAWIVKRQRCWTLNVVSSPLRRPRTCGAWCSWTTLSPHMATRPITGN